MACRWSRRDGACAVSQKWVGSKLRKSDVTDPLCFLFTIPDRSECLDINNYFSCVLRGDQCEWKTRTGITHHWLNIRIATHWRLLSCMRATRSCLSQSHRPRRSRNDAEAARCKSSMPQSREENMFGTPNDISAATIIDQSPQFCANKLIRF